MHFMRRRPWPWTFDFQHDSGGSYRGGQQKSETDDHPRCFSGGGRLLLPGRVHGKKVKGRDYALRKKRGKLTERATENFTANKKIFSRRSLEGSSEKFSVITLMYLKSFSKTL